MAAPAAEVPERVCCQTSHHSFATQLLERDAKSRKIQDLPGPSDVRTTRISTQMLNQGFRGVRSSGDLL